MSTTSSTETRRVMRIELPSGSTDANEPDYRSKVVKDQLRDVQIVRDVYDGTLRLRECGETYLPRFPAEEQGDYDRRLDTSVLYNATRRSVRGLTGMVFRKPPKLAEDVPALIRGTDDQGMRGHWENIDAAGRHGNVFVRDFTNDTLLDGHRHILVDFPEVDVPFRNRTEERQADLRPYWIEVPKTSVMSWRSDVLDGKVTLVQFAYEQITREAEGEFGDEEVRRIRVYTLLLPGDEDPTGEGAPLPAQDGRRVRLRVYREAKKEQTESTKPGTATKRWELERDRLLSGLSRIPVTTGYGGERVDFMVSRPALLDLVLENIRHYQLRSDRDNTLHICGVPIPWATGRREEDALSEKKVSSRLGFDLEKGGTVGYLEPQGVALEATANELDKIEGRMAALGLSMLERKTRAAETAKARQLEKSEQDSQLASVVSSIKDAVEEALSFHAEWLGLGAAAGGSVELNRDFSDLPLDAAVIRELREMVAEGDLDQDTLWDVLIRYEVLPDTFNPDEVRARLEASGAREMRDALERARLRIAERGDAGQQQENEEPEAAVA